MPVTVAFAVAANAQKLDCEALKTSTVPFELTMEPAPGVLSFIGPITRMQVYRERGNSLVTYSARAHDVAAFTKTVYVSTLAIEQTNLSAGRTTKYEYPNVDLNHFKPDTTLIRYDILVIDGWSPTVFRESREQAVIETGTLSVGPCEFRVLKIEHKSKIKPEKPTDSDADQEVEIKVVRHYSPELGISLVQDGVSRNVTTGGSELKFGYRATNIKTEFEPLPLREP